MFNFLKTKFSIKKDKSIFEEYAAAKDAVGMYNLTGKLPNPDVILRKTGKGLKALRELKSNYQVGTCIESRKSGVTSKKWRLNKKDCAENQYKFFDEIFKNIDIHKLIEDILEAPLFGFAPIEISYEKSGSYIVPVSLTAKPQEWFYFNTEGEFFFNSRKNSNGFVIEPENPKFLLARHRADFLNPYGECLLSRCFWNVIFINGGMEFWLKFMEKYGPPWAIGKYDRSMDDSEQKDLLKMLKRMVQDAVAVIPADGSVELINASDKSGSNAVFQSFVTKCENNISKVILGQTLTTDVGATGSYAASNTHQEVRADLIQNDVRLCENTINEFIKKVYGLNFNDTNYPVFEIYDEDGIDQSIAERDNKVQTLGVKFTKKYIQKAYGYEDDDFEMVEFNEDENAEFADGRNVVSPDSECEVDGNVVKSTTATSVEQIKEAEFADKQDDDFSKMEQVVENFGSADYDKFINEALKPVLELFKSSRNAEECMEMLAEIYPDMKTEELENTLTKVIFLAELMGRVE